MRSLTTTQRGFSIMEALIYIALFTFVIGGGLLSAYSIFDGTARTDQKAAREVELNFLLRKLDWASSGVIVSPSDASADTLIVNRDGSQYTFTMNSGVATLATGGETYPLTELLTIDSLTFTHTAGTPEILTIEIEAAGETIAPITRYVRTN